LLKPIPFIFKKHFHRYLVTATDIPNIAYQYIYQDWKLV